MNFFSPSYFSFCYTYWSRIVPCAYMHMHALPFSQLSLHFFTFILNIIYMKAQANKNEVNFLFFICIPLPLD